MFTQFISAKIDTFKIRKNRLAINELQLDNNSLYLKLDSANKFNFSFILESFSKKDKDTTELWNINCNNFNFNQLNIDYQDKYSSKNDELNINNLNLSVSNFYSLSDSLSFRIEDLNLNDGQNLELK
ncbi:MAG: hypothetical protein R3182_10210, partial [Draconibacterium sp.]|nr:hypothetical protein [Draconibacterium sp.]